MKKIIITLLLLMLLPLKVLAYYDYDNIFINATLESNGDLLVEEYMDMSGEYNGSTIAIKYRNESLMELNRELKMLGGSKIHNADSINIIEIKGIDKNSDYDFQDKEGDLFHVVESAKSGEYGKYTMELLDDNNGYFLTIYNSSKKNKALYLKYKLTNIGVVHDDVGELFWTIFTSDSASIENVKITINFPNNTSELKVWAHGGRHGKVENENNTKLIATISPQNSYTSLDVRATFDKNVLINSTKYSHINALPKILEYETNETSNIDYKTISEIESNITECDEYPRRYCYEKIESLVNKLNDKELKGQYQVYLENLHQKVNEAEEKNAETEVRMAEDYLTYYYYKNANLVVKKLENIEVRQKLEERLEIVYEKVVIKETKTSNTFILIGIPLVTISIVTTILIYIFLDRDSKSKFKEYYLRDLPEDYSPTSLSYLLHKKITKESISAEILLEINNGNIIVEKIPYKNDYILKKSNKYEIGINSKSDKIMNFIFCYGEPIELSKLKKRCKSAPSRVASKYDSLISTCKKENKKLKIYTTDEQSNFFGEYLQIVISLLIWLPLSLMLPCIGPLILMIIIAKILSKEYKKNKNKLKIREIIKIILNLTSFISFIFATITLFIFALTNSIIKTGMNLYIFTLIICAINMSYSIMCTNRTEKGSTDYSKWKAVKNFLKDFGKMDDKELPEVSLWKEYLAYAMVLGCSKKLAKTMAIKVPDFKVDELNDINYTTTIINDISRSVSDCVSSARSYSSYDGGGSFSGSSGGGGTFSSSSGSSGGGGGGSSVGRF